MRELLFQTSEVSVHPLDAGILVLYLVAMIVLGFYLARGIKTSKGYFLAGRALPWWIVGFSIMGTNLSAGGMMGSMGNAYRFGIVQANFEWIGAIPAMIAAAFLFVPFYWKSGVYSVPEFLGLRYNKNVRFLVALIMCFFSLFLGGIGLWATALMLNTFLGWSIAFSLLATGVVIGIYTTAGGLKAVAYTDAVQIIIITIGSIFIFWFGLQAVGGWEVFSERMASEYPRHLRSFLPVEHDIYPWPGILLGLGLVLSPAFWCTNQAIIQRTLGAHTVWDAQASMLFAGLLKCMVPLLLIVPGFFVLIMRAEALDLPDQALPWLIKNLLPAGISGVLFVTLIAALQSTVDSTLNAVSTMFSRDIVQHFYKRPLAERTMLRLGRWTTVAGIIISLSFAPMAANFASIFVFAQVLVSLFQGPLLAIMLFGILSKRPTATGGITTLVLGIVCAAVLHATGLNMLHVAFWSFVFSIVVLFGVSAFTTRKTDGELKNLTIYTI